jgi:amino acid adenylation domain-containing protein
MEGFRKAIDNILKKEVKISLDSNGTCIKVRGDIASLTDEDKKNLANYKSHIIELLLKEKEGKLKNLEGIPSVEQDENYPISDAQRRLWILSQFEEGNVAYNMPVSHDLLGDYQIEYFVKAINWVIGRHEILRTVFKVDENGEPKQWILPAEVFDFEITYLDYRHEPDKDNKVQSYIEEDSSTPFDLEKGPLLRAALMRLEEERYVFYFNMHHIICDGWSMEVLVNDVLHCYQAFKNDKLPDLPKLEIHYKDYAAWHKNQLETSTTEQTYWKSQLSGDLPILKFPGSKERPKVKTFTGHTLGAYLDVESSQLLKAYCQNNGGSLFIGLTTLWKILCYRYTGQRDILTGSPVAGRDHSDLNNQIGFYVNMIVLRASLDPDKSFDLFFDQMKETMLLGFRHQMYPFDRLVEDLEIPKDTSRNPIFDVILTLNNTPENTQSTTDIDSGKILDLGPGTAKFDLDVIFEVIGDGIFLKIVYNRDIYDRALIEQMIAHYQKLLSEVMRQPQLKLGEINILTDRELELLESFNQTTIEYKNESSVIVAFHKVVSEQPDHPAVVFEGKSITYAQVDELSNQLAHFLVAKNVQSEELIGIRLERSDVLIIAILGVLKAGCAYVPIDPNYPQERQNFILQDSNCRICIDQEFLEKYYEEIKVCSQKPVNKKYESNHLAYVIYTSGSTGKPKGVMIEQGSIVNLCNCHKRIYAVSGLSKSTLVANVGFDASPWEIFPYLLSGATVYPLNNEDRLDPDRLKEYCDTNKITHVFLPTALYKSFSGKFNDFRHQLNLLVGGEELDADYDLKGVKLYNNYGPTENTVVATAHQVDGSIKKGMIGKPIDNVRVEIVDEFGNQCPIGVTGEILIGGSGLARGYWRDKELTDRKFTGSGDSRRYHTGDLGQWDITGNVIFKGRSDNQVKIRGNRIELGEIEQKVRSNSKVKDVLVLLDESPSGEKSLVAYFTTYDGFDLTALKVAMREELPDYMMPKYFVELSKFPLTANQKVDKKQLPAPDYTASNSSLEYVPPSNELEQQLTAVFAHELGVDSSKIGTHDNFFDMGFNSLKMIGLVKKINQETGIKVQLVTFFQHQNIKELSAFLIGEEEEELEEDENVGDDIDDFIDLMEL